MPLLPPQLPADKFMRGRATREVKIQKRYAQSIARTTMKLLFESTSTFAQAQTSQLVSHYPLVTWSHKPVTAWCTITW